MARPYTTINLSKKRTFRVRSSRGPTSSGVTNFRARGKPTSTRTTRVSTSTSSGTRPPGPVASRGAPTPQEPDEASVSKGSSASPKDYRISLRSSRRISRLIDVAINKPLIFKVTPDFTENRQVNYKTMDPVHLPGNIHVFGSTSSRTFQISNAKLISNTPEEATENMAFIQRLRGWTMPFFGNSNTSSFATTPEGNIIEPNVDLKNSFFNIDNFLADKPATQPPGGAAGPEVLGLPPEVLLLTGYAPNVDFNVQSGKLPTNVYRVPVVITNLVIPYPAEVDYVPTINNQPFPRIITIDVQLTETHSPQEYERFSLSEYRTGVLNGF